MVLFVVVQASCNNGEKYPDKYIRVNDTLIIRKSFYDDGTIKGEVLLNNDSLRKGNSKYYYEDGKLRLSINIEHGVKEGEARAYHSNGQLLYIGKYHKDSKDSTWIYYNKNGAVEVQEQWDKGAQDSAWVWYHKNGEIDQIDYWDKGTLLFVDTIVNEGHAQGQRIHYYKNGKIRVYEFYQFNELMYSREYNSNGDIIKEKGKIPADVVYNSDLLNIGDKYHMVISVGLLPEWDANLEIVDVTNGKREIVKKIHNRKGFEKVYWGYRIIVEDKSIKAGTYKWLVNITVTDENGKEMKYSKVFTRTVKSK